MKLTKLLLLAATTLTLASCGGEKVDVNLYSLKLSYSDNVASKAEFNKMDLVAEYAYGVNGDIHKLSDETLEELRKNGVTQESLNMHGQKENDAYRFFDGDPLHIFAPEVTGYRYLGYFKKGSTSEYPDYKYKKVLDSDGVYRYTRWNMEKNSELVARYEELKYSVTYDTEVVKYGLGDNLPNNSVYNAATDGEIILKTPNAPEGKVFKRWVCRCERFDYNIGEYVSTLEEIRKLPRDYDETILFDYPGGLGITLFAEYDDIAVKPIIVFKDENGGILTNMEKYITENITDPAGFPLPHSDEYAYGTYYGFRVDVDAIMGELVEFNGIYVDGIKIPDVDIGGGLTRLNNVLEPIRLTRDVNIEIRTLPAKASVSFIYEKDNDFVDLDTVCESATVFGERTWVNDVLAYPNPIELSNYDYAFVRVGSTFSLSLTVKENIIITKCEFETAPVSGTVKGDTYTYSFTINDTLYTSVRIFFAAV